MSAYAYPLNLSCSDIGCDRGGVPILRGASFELKAGEAIQIFGANGTGKSTLLSVISGRARPAQGQVVWTNMSDASETALPQYAMAILDHEGALKKTLTVAENLTFWRRLYEKSEPDMQSALKLAGMEARSRQAVSTLSAGQRRRLSFARLILADRPVWLLDEPATSIDADGRDDVTKLIRAHLGRGGLALIATHHELVLPGARLRLG